MSEDSPKGGSGGRFSGGRPRAASRRGSAGAREGPRGRLMAAAVELASEQGYAATSVADVIARAGASRKTFYEHFEDKRACFLAVGDEISREWVARAQGAVMQADDAGEALVLFVKALFDLSRESPEALHLIAAELTAAGRPGIARRERLMHDLGRTLGDTLEGLAEEDDEVDTGFRMPQEDGESLLVRSLTGGILHSAHERAWRRGRVRRPRSSELEALVGDVAQWAGLFRLVPEPPLLPFDGFVPTGGRAPGTLSLDSRASARRGLPRGESSLSRSFVVHNQRERLLDALANLSAAKGYGAVTIPEIVQEAAVSVQAFYEHFSSKEDAFAVAYELGQRKLLAIVERAYEAHNGDWPEGVWSGLGALLDFLASEPSYTRMSLVDALTAGARVSALARYGESRLGHLLRPGLERVEREVERAGVLVEGTVHALQALCYAYAANERAREMTTLLGLAAHVALTPFLGRAVGEVGQRGTLPHRLSPN